MKKRLNQLEKEVVRYSPTYLEGLTNDQVEERISNGLTNFVEKKYSKTYLSIFTENICTFFNLLGLIVMIALIAVGAKLSNFFFVFFYVANTSISIFQEIRAKRCIDKLTLVSSTKLKAIRNGEKVDVYTNEIVLDEVFCLGIGNQIPTDCIVLDGSVEVNEALLTGESVPIKKCLGDTLLAGSFIVSGNCIVQAVKIGKDSYAEKLSEKAKQYKKPQSEIMTSLSIMIKSIALIIIPIAVALLIKSSIKENIVEAVLSTSTVVIGMIPAGMFLLTSVALAIGIIKLAKHNALVQDLYSLEMLARVDTICFDKTGTLTDGKMTVTELNLLDETNYNKENIRAIISSMLFSLKDTNQTAIALSDYFGQDCHFNSKTVLPFSSQRKLSAITFDNGDTYSFGAPEFVLAKEEYNKIEKAITDYAQLGYRVLVFAKSSSEIIDNTPPSDFTSIALIILADNIRSEAYSTIQWFKDNDVDIKVISGDNPLTVSEVSKRVGINNAHKYISLEGKSDEEVFALANDYTVFGRVSPEQKAILIKALRSAGHVTAMTGDGVNDLLALKESNCAVTVASGSDAARKVSHIVLMDNNFSTMPQVVYEGRRVINNVQSSASLFLMKTLFTMILSIIMLISPLMKTYPFKLSQMILLEVFIIGLPAFFLSLQPNTDRVKGKFIIEILKKTLPCAILMVMSVMLIQVLKNRIPNPFDSSVYSTLSLYALNLAGLICLFFVCKPLNKFRTVIYSFSFVIVVGQCVISLFTGFEMLELVKLAPISQYWHHLLYTFGVVIVDVPLYLLIEKLFSKIKLQFLDKASKKLNIK